MVVLNGVHTLFKIFHTKKARMLLSWYPCLLRSGVARYHPAAPAPRTPRDATREARRQRRTPCSRPVEWTPWVALIGRCFPARALRL